MPMGLAIFPMKKGKGMGKYLLEEKDIFEDNRVASGNDFSNYRDTKVMVLAGNDLGTRLITRNIRCEIVNTFLT
jgi:hypothetical protein